MDTIRPCNNVLKGRVETCSIPCWLSTEHLFKGLSCMRGSTVGFLFDANTVAMLMSPNHAVTRLGKLLLSRMKRNSRSALAEVWDAESAFAEPDAELVGHPIVWFFEPGGSVSARCRGGPSVPPG